MAKAPQVDRIERARLETALRAIPTEQREVLLLVAVERMSYAQTARALAIPVGTVVAQLSRARDRLHQLMRGARRVR